MINVLKPLMVISTNASYSGSPCSIVKNQKAILIKFVSWSSKTTKGSN